MMGFDAFVPAVSIVNLQFWMLTIAAEDPSKKNCGTVAPDAHRKVRLSNVDTRVLVGNVELMEVGL
jgi:hypothetical protein